MTGRAFDLHGHTFGRLTVIGRAGNKDSHGAWWECHCSCGRNAAVPAHRLRSGKTRSCGCLGRELARTHRVTHGMRKSRIYIIWHGMIARCENLKRESFADYGGRGISVCPEWHSFEAFLEWSNANGYSDDLTIDRVDNDGNYEPDNCRWATRLEQAGNTRRSKLTDRDVVEIRSDARRPRFIAADYNICASYVRDIKAARRRDRASSSPPLSEPTNA